MYMHVHVPPHTYLTSGVAQGRQGMMTGSIFTQGATPGGRTWRTFDFQFQYSVGVRENIRPVFWGVSGRERDSCGHRRASCCRAACMEGSLHSGSSETVCVCVCVCVSV